MTWRWVLVLGAAGSAAYGWFAGTAGAELPAALTYASMSATATAGTLLGALRQPRAASAPWWWLVAMQALWATAGTVEAVGVLTGRHVAPVVVEAAYLLGYVAPVVALSLLVRRSRAARPPGSLADAAVLGTGLALLCWASVVGPARELHPGDPWAQLATSTFVIGDMTAVLLVVVLLVWSSRVTTSSWLLLAAVLASVLGDTSVLVGSHLPTWLSSAMSLGWTATAVLWAAAALHPSASTPVVTTVAAPFSPARFAAMLVGMLLAPFTLAIDLLTGRSTASWPAVATTTVVSVLVVVRLGLALRAAAASLAERELMRQALERQARTDSLTGLPNRAATVELLSAALLRAGRGEGDVGLLFIDLDGFKAVNDTHGHRAGDELLRVVGSRLQGCLRGGGTVGRLGGDEFVVVLGPVEGATGDSAFLAVAQRVVDEVAEPVDVGGHVVCVGASVGVAVVRSGGATTADALLHEADTAVYVAKSQGRGRVVLAAGPVATPAPAEPVRLPAPR